MKRLRKIGHVTLVWTSVCLLLVDPAAACKLRNRRCCCCCECMPAVCEATAPAASAEPSPADAPPQASTGAGQLPPTPLAADSPSVSPAHPVANDPVKSLSPDKLNLADRAAPTTVTIAPARPNEPRIVEPNIAPAAPIAAPRRLADVAPPAATEIAPPAVVITDRPTRSSDLTPPAPQSASLQQRQPQGPTVTSAPPVGGPGATSPAAPDSVAAAAPGEVKRSKETPSMPAADSQAANPPRKPAKPGSSAAAAPVVPPSFPPVADDPFSPAAPAVATPRPVETHEDDPFAPLQPATQPEAKPAAPIAAEPTMKLVDPLLPGADGQLPARHWSDHSGQFRVRARLLLILDGKVRLLKETGRTTTVPTERLSDADRSYVEEVISRHGKDLSKLGELAAG